jgi:hypothetical protein
MASFQAKLNISLGSAVLFLLFNSPQAYKLTSGFTKAKLYENGCPTNLGLIVHTIIFFLITYFFSMSKSSTDSGIKLKHAVYGTLIYFFVSSPALYSFVSSILGSGIATKEGCPTNTGLLVHTVVYCMALVAVMYLTNKE